MAQRWKSLDRASMSSTSKCSPSGAVRNSIVDMPSQKMTTAGRRGKDELTPIRADLMDALLLGQREEARKILADYLDDFPSIAEKKAKLQSLASTVSSNQPARVGGAAGNECRVEFMEWAKKRLAVKDLTRIQAVDE